MPADRPPSAPPLPDAPPGPPPGVVDPDARLDTRHQLPPHRGKIGRIADHVAALSNDVTEYIELRIELVKAEIEEKKQEVEAQVRRKATPLVFFAAAGVVGLYLLGFVLTTLAWLFAWWFGADPVFMPTFLGFLAVTVLLAVAAGALAMLGRRKQREAEAIEARLKAPDVAESQEAIAAPPSVRQYQEREAQRARRTTA